MESKINVSSEVNILKRVLVHRPDDGIARVSPKMAEILLFDDIVHVPKMKQEHDVFTQVLKAFIGDQGVLEMHDLLEQALNHAGDGRIYFLDRIALFEELPDSYLDLLKNLPNRELAEVLITGYYKDKDFYLFHPIPNFIFTRDLAVTLKDHILITKAAKDARERENLLTRLIVWHHPIFADTKKEERIINMNDINVYPPSQKGEQISIEGGDVMVLNEDYILIGNSERTSDYAIQCLKKTLFKKGIFKNVVQINIPADRSFMHIDTLFTLVDYDLVVAHKPIIYDGKNSNVIVYKHDGHEVIYNSVRDFFHSEINPDMQFVFGGDGESPYQEREQWTDGCNLVVVKPGVALGYDRNLYTDKAFRDKGYSIIHAKDFLSQVTSGAIKPSELAKTLISLPSGELSRARGGSHCMTCPIERD